MNQKTKQKTDLHFAKLFNSGGENNSPFSQSIVNFFDGRKHSLFSSFFYFIRLCSALLAVPGKCHSVSWFSTLHGASTKFSFDCDTKERFLMMFRVCVVVCLLLSACQSCRLIVPAELLNGCVFDPMIVSVSHAGFSINKENCNTAIAKHIFAEQPLVYYGRAKSVGFPFSKCFFLDEFL